MARTLPRWMHEKHGAYYLVRNNKWHRLAGNLHDALVEYARLTAGPDKGALGELVAKTLGDMKLTVAASTFKNYTSCSRRVLESFEEFTPQQIKPHHVARFLDDNKATPRNQTASRCSIPGRQQGDAQYGKSAAELPTRNV